MISEDRSDHEGYVLSYPQPGAPPLKVKIKHANFLTMQHIVHSATPKAILEALENDDQPLITSRHLAVPGPVTDWIQDWVVKLRSAEDDIHVRRTPCTLTLARPRIAEKSLPKMLLKRHQTLLLYALLCWTVKGTIANYGGPYGIDLARS